MDNAYYQKKFVAKVTKHGWDFSMSLTDGRVKSAIIDQIDENAVWTPIPDKDDDDVEVQETMVKPSKWARAHRCTVIRRWMKKEGEQDLFPTHTVVMTSRLSLSRDKVLKRHWQKQGFENGFKGPLREMNLHHPPSTSLGGNQVYYLCGLIAQMLLTHIQYTFLPESARKVGLRPLIRNVMRCIGRVTESSRRLTLIVPRDSIAIGWMVAGIRHVESMKPEPAA